MEKTRTNKGKKKKKQQEKTNTRTSSVLTFFSLVWVEEGEEGTFVFVLMAMFVFLGPKVFNISNQQHMRRTLSIRSELNREFDCSQCFDLEI